MVGRSIVLPELADLLSLPAPDGFAVGCGLCRRQALAQGKAADGGAVDLVLETAQYFGSDHAVRAMGFEQLTDQESNRLGPGRVMIAAGGLGRPEVSFAFCDGAEVLGIELIEASLAEG